MLKINVIETNGYRQDDLVKLQQAVSNLESVVNSECFKQKVKTFPFHFRKNLFGGYKDIPFSNEEILSIIEKPSHYPGKFNDKSIDLYLHIIDGEDQNVIGFGFEGENKIYTYRKMFVKMQPAQIANHIMYEWLLKLGFKHPEQTIYFTKRSRSVPFAVGKIVEKLARKKNKKI